MECGENDLLLKMIVIGSGPIGLMHLQLSLIAGAQKVIVSELDPEKRALALKLGACRAVDSRDATS